MKRGYLLFFCVVFLCPFFLEFSVNPQITDTEKQYRFDKELKSILAKLIHLEKDTFNMGQFRSTDIQLTASDSTLFMQAIPRRAIVDSFYISATEVTNGEWRKFYADKVSELGKEMGKRKFYPDTSLWIKEFPYTYMESQAKNYFSKPAYDDYPVVGITWDQAKAYCRWKSKNLQTILEKIGIKSSIEFRLPTEAEWEYAAIKNEDQHNFGGQRQLRLDRRNKMAQLNDHSNIGQLYDINKVLLKQYADDGCLYTCKVGTYPANYSGLFNMTGNVSEWTSTEGYVWANGFKNRKSKSLTSLIEIENELEHLHEETGVEKPYIDLSMARLTQAKKIFQTKNIKICKGGSWAHGLVYSLPGSRQGIGKEKASTKIGFRIAISNLDQELLKYLPKKNWEPTKVKIDGRR